MTDTNDGTALSTAEAAEHLRRLRDTLGPDQLREAFETGGGLMEHEENRLREALDVLGTQRTAEILDVEVPDSGLPGEQVTIGGEPVSGRVPEERAEPVPDDTASLSEFEGEEEERDEIDERGNGTTRAEELTEEEAFDVVQRALDIEGPDAIAAFLDPDEIAPLGQAISFQLSGAVETLGEERVREIAGLEEGDTGTS
jgi:hypothetical protein